MENKIHRLCTRTDIIDDRTDVYGRLAILQAISTHLMILEWKPYEPHRILGHNTSSDLTSHIYHISGIISTFATTKDAGPQKSVIDLYPYLEKLSEIIRKYKTRYPPYNFVVILAAQKQEKRAYLKYIDYSGLPSDIYDSYKILGSGNIVANPFLKSVWSKDITMEDFGELCYFIIKYFIK